MVTPHAGVSMSPHQNFLVPEISSYRYLRMARKTWYSMNIDDNATRTRTFDLGTATF